MKIFKEGTSLILFLGLIVFLYEKSIFDALIIMIVCDVAVELSKIKRTLQAVYCRGVAENERLHSKM